MPFSNVFQNPFFWKTFFSGNKFSYNNISNLHGKVAIVTGATGGLGYATVVALAAHGAHVFLACRNRVKAEEAIERAQADILKLQFDFPDAIHECSFDSEKNRPRLEFLELDLGEMSKCRSAATEFLERGLPLHILVNNGGVLHRDFELSEDGYEHHFAINHLGHFVFTTALLERIRESAPARIVVLSSMAHEMPPSNRPIDYKTLRATTPQANNYSRYGQSRLANVLFTKALARRLRNERVWVNVVHPGIVDTQVKRGILESDDRHFKNFSRTWLMMAAYPTKKSDPMNDAIFSTQRFRRKCLITIGGLVLVNITVWILAAIAAKNYPSLLGSMVIAYTLGLRHAVDADHLAAIDNVTRKLIYQDSVKSQASAGRRDDLTPPVCVGLFFSLGHSTIVIVASVAVAAAATSIENKLEAFGETGGIIGTSVSVAFLLLIGLLNAYVLYTVGSELREIHKTGEYRYRDPIKEALAASSEEKTTSADAPGQEDGSGSGGRGEVKRNASRHPTGGLFIRLFRPLFNLIDRSWKMYPLGVLFGLGFDTATEVGMLGIAATSAHAGFPTAVIMIFPALFTAGMSLIDTLDGVFMANAYGWAFVNPVKKLWYNFVVTFMGVIVAFVVGIAELLGLLANRLELTGSFWEFFITLSDNFGLIGYVIVGVFVLTWLFAVLFYKYGPIKELEARVVVIEEGSSEIEEAGDLEQGRQEKSPSDHGQ
ncbi:hypothetical protein BGZ75_000193 [Mortierella antarctica]|nr:hypothetical protein BGZ75_000193 [Mortierella antarctica]